MRGNYAHEVAPLLLLMLQICGKVSVGKHRQSELTRTFPGSICLQSYRVASLYRVFSQGWRYAQ